MSISTNYDYNKYSQYSNSISSLWGQQGIQNSKDTQNADSSLQISLDSRLETSENKHKSPLSSLVEAGTITSEQEKAIKDALEVSRLAHQTHAGTANTTNPLASLVEAGTISEEQATAVKSAFDSAKKAMMPPPPPPQNNSIDSITSILDGLLEAGKITEEQQDSIINALQSEFTSNETDNNTTLDFLNSLTESDTSTEEQQATMKSVFETAINAYFAQSYSYNDIFQNSFETTK